MMGVPLFSRNGTMSTANAYQTFEKFEKFLKWRSEENILDVGCGDIDVALNVLLPRLPKNFNKLVAMDISEEAIQCVKSKLKHPKIETCVLDICSPTVPLKFHEHFDHIFPLMLLHWVPDPRQALRNMFAMLKPGGQMLVTLMVKVPLYDTLEILAKSQKWAPFITENDKIIPFWTHCEDPVNIFENLLKEAGFLCHSCELENRNFVHPTYEDFTGLALSVNPYIKKVPQDNVSAFVEDYLSVMTKLEGINISYGDDNKERTVDHFHQVLIAVVSKPE